MGAFLRRASNGGVRRLRPGESGGSGQLASMSVSEVNVDFDYSCSSGGCTRCAAARSGHAGAGGGGVVGTEIKERKVWVL